MKATGIVRRIDDLGRVVIPKEIRRTLRIREGDPLEIYTEKDGEVTDYHNDTTLMKTMLKQARKRYLIATSNKFDRTTFSRVCNLSEFDVIITDSDLPQTFQDLIHQNGIELIMADK